MSCWSDQDRQDFNDSHDLSRYRHDPDYLLRKAAKLIFLREIISVVSKTDDQVIIHIPAYKSLAEVDFRKKEFSEDDWKKLQPNQTLTALVNSDVGSCTDLLIKDVQELLPNQVSLMNDREIQKNSSLLSNELLVAEVLRLRAAIQGHRTQTVGHGMCWENDRILWRAIDPNAEYPHLTMPSPEEMLAQCKVYIDSRLKGLPYVEPEPKTHAVTIDGKVIEGSSNVRRSE